MSVMGNQRKNNVSDQQILQCYQGLRSAAKAAKVLGIGGTTVYRVLVRHGIECTGLSEYRKSITKFQGQEAQIRSWYESGDTLEQIRQKLGGGSDYAIRHALKRAGGKIRENAPFRIKPGELERIKELHAAGMGQIPISLQIGRSQSFVSRTMRKFGIAAHATNGPSHSMWKGGRFSVGNGYVRVWIDPDSKFSSMRDSSGYALEHRLVMARHLGRPLGQYETVHHVDGDPANNAIENLQLRHGKHGKHVAMICLDCGSHNVGPSALKEPV